MPVAFVEAFSVVPWIAHGGGPSTTAGALVAAGGPSGVVQACTTGCCARIAWSRTSSLSERKLDALFMAGFPPKAGNRALISANF